MRLAHLVAATDDVAATSARKEKIGHLAELLRTADPTEMAVVVGLLSGDPRQGRIGVGWATVRDLEAGVAEVGAAHTPSRSVADLDRLLDTVAGTHGEGSQGARRDLLVDFLAGATPSEADYVRRLLIGELRQGANAGIVTAAVAEAAEVPATVLRRAVMLMGDLGAAAEIAAAEGRAGLDRVGLELHRPIQPMLASTAKGVAEAIAELGRCSVEWKLDGVRVQVHKRSESVRVWTRNLNEITGGVPEVVEIVGRLPARDLVLDGEVLGVDDEGQPLVFQDTMANDSSVVPFFFDLLHHDGDDLLDSELAERLVRLEQVVGDRKIPGSVTDQSSEGEAVLAAALDHNHEGVMVKAIDSPYQAGRRGKSWRKVKPVHTLDLVVLAVEHGSGRRKGCLSNIHLGARDPATGGFVMVGKTFKGMSDEMLRWQTEHFGTLAVDDNGWQVTVRPEQVVEIAVDGVQRSTRYPGGIALRFARVVRYRDDKSPAEVDTIDTVRALG